MPSMSRGAYHWLLNSPAILEDFADRLNHFWTVGLLLILACVVSWKHGYSDPIQCWCPSEFNSQMVQYTESICWNAASIQYIENIEEAAEILKLSIGPMTTIDGLPLVSVSAQEFDSLSEAASTTTLYQWLPLIMCFQALLFKLPNVILYVFHGLSGVSFDKIHGLTFGYENMSLDERQTLGRHISHYVLRWCRQCGSFPWRVLTLLWLCVKILYCINIIVQLCVLNSYLVQESPINTSNITSFGEQISENMFGNNASLWKESPVLPKYIRCRFQIRQFESRYTYLVNCHLPANHFNEKVFMYLWVWFVFVATVTCTSLAVWLMATLLPCMRKR